MAVSGDSGAEQPGFESLSLYFLISAMGTLIPTHL